MEKQASADAIWLRQSYINVGVCVCVSICVYQQY